MKAYGITTYATEDTEQMTCYYSYSQWIELIKSFKASGIDFNAFVTEI